jgi:hypothetical protein
MISARFSVFDSGTLTMVRLPILSLSFFVALSAGALSAQIPIPRANVEIDAAGVFAVDGFKAEEYSTGPGLRVGGEFRLHRNLIAERGWTGAWMATYYNCSRFVAHIHAWKTNSSITACAAFSRWPAAASIYLLAWAAVISGSTRPPVTTIIATAPCSSIPAKQRSPSISMVIGESTSPSALGATWAVPFSKGSRRLRESATGSDLFGRPPHASIARYPPKWIPAAR